MRLLAIIALSIVILTVLFVGFYPLVAPPDRNLSRANACEANLRMIVHAMLVYGEENRGLLPDSLDSLVSAHGVVTKAGLTPGHFVCPAVPGETLHDFSGVPEGTHYRFPSMGNGATLSEGSVCLLYCPPENHRGVWAIAGYLDGQTRRIGIADYNDFLVGQGVESVKSSSMRYGERDVQFKRETNR